MGVARSKYVYKYGNGERGLLRGAPKGVCCVWYIGDRERITKAAPGCDAQCCNPCLSALRGCRSSYLKNIFWDRDT
eukprot:scaffold17997_cov101-Isochrysis_galbana.AAC.5